MKMYIDKLESIGVVFPMEKTIDLVLLSFHKSYGQFVKNFHIRNLDVTLIDLTQMLMVVEAKMLKNTSEVEMLIGFDSKVSIDIGNGDISGPEKDLSSQWKEVVQDQTV